MDSQQQQVYNFSQQMESTENYTNASLQTTTVTATTSTLVYKEPHILDRPSHAHLATPFDKLEVLCVSLVDFDNMKHNGINLTEELIKEGWETTFRDSIVQSTHFQSRSYGDSQIAMTIASSHTFWW